MKIFLILSFVYIQISTKAQTTIIGTVNPNSTLTVQRNITGFNPKQGHLEKKYNYNNYIIYKYNTINTQVIKVQNSF
jgi:hypothetical protein